MLTAAERVVLCGQQLTTTRIAKVAGVSVGSLYQYFPNKQLLLVALAERYMARDAKRFEALLDSLRDNPLRQIVETLCGAMLETYAHNAQVRAVLIEQLHATASVPLMRTYFDRYTAAIAHLLAPHAVGPERELNERRAFVAFFAAEGVMREAAMRHLDERERKQLAPLIAQQAYAVLVGVGRPALDPDK